MTFTFAAHIDWRNNKKKKKKDCWNEMHLAYEFKMTARLQSPFLLAALAAVALFPSGISGDERERFLSHPISNFTLRLLQSASETDDANVAFSPFCISLLLGVLQQGAAGTSAEQLENLTWLPPNAAKVYFRAFLKYIGRSAPGDIMKWGNRMFVRQDLELNPVFEDNLEKFFNVSIEKIDFSSGESVNGINDWVSNITKNHIPKAIDQADVGIDTVTLLVSAIYFSDMWDVAFNVRDSEDNRFYMDDKTNLTVGFMVQKNRDTIFGEDYNLGARWIRLRYSKAKSISMMFVLPTTRFDLDKLLKRMTEKDILRMFKENHMNSTTVYIPKFKISGDLHLPYHLQRLGITDIFTENANLIGMFRESGRISDITHGCRIEVNEKGTSAAAVAAAKFQFLSGSMVFPDNAVFRADEPFLFIIFDEEIQVPLFAGKVGNPKGPALRQNARV